VSEVQLTIGGGRPEPSGARLVLTLAIAGFLSGLGLAGVYELTRPAIERNQAERRERAVLTVVPGATTMQRLVWEADAFRPARADERAVGLAVFAAYDAEGSFKGYAIEGEGAGFQDAIRLIFGYDPARRMVIGMQILESRETPGLGDKIYKDEEFVANFQDLAVEPAIELVKDGRTAQNEVDAITGATISSRAVVRIIAEARETWADRLPDDPGPMATASAAGGDDGRGS
jgi:electron transport complex protein RnfG